MRQVQYFLSDRPWRAGPPAPCMVRRRLLIGCAPHSWALRGRLKWRGDDRFPRGGGVMADDRWSRASAKPIEEMVGDAAVKGRRPKPTHSVLEFRPLLEGRRPPPRPLGSFLVSPETDLDFLLIEDFFASIVIFGQEAS